MDVRTYGQLAHADNTWYLRTEPHVTIRVKRMFPRMSPNAQGVLTITDTLDVCRDLHWLLTRWPLTMKAADRAYLDGRVQKSIADEATVRAIRGGLRLTGEMYLQPAVEPRPYQVEAADVALATGSNLVVHGLGLGKAQPLTAGVLTPAGFRPMGSLAVGDTVIAADGTPTTVTGIFDQGVLDSYQVTLSDGSSTRCNGEHLWAVRSCRSTSAPVSVKTLRELMDSGLRNSCGQAKWHVPLAQPADFIGGDPLPLDPYLVGVLLGDGSLTIGSAKFSSIDQDVIDQVAAALPPGITVARAGNSCDYRLVQIGAQTPRKCQRCDRLKTVARGLCGRCYQQANANASLPEKAGAPPHALLGPLRALEMWGHGALTKRIPERYLHASAKDRLALLQGLMDTDGSATAPPRSNGCTTIFTSASRQLALDVQWITRSLGGVARLSSAIKSGRQHYSVVIKMPTGVIPFRLTRKADRVRTRTATAPTHAIIDVQPTGRELMRCISVAHPDRLYVTDDFMVTHNTFTGLLVLRDPAARPAMVATLGGVMPRQWVRQVNKFFPDLTAVIGPTGQVSDQRMRQLLDADVVVLPYSRLAKYQPFLQGHTKTVIFDEVQELRHEGSMKYNAAAAIASQAAFRVGLTGTPVYGYSGEIFDIIQVHEPGVLGSKTEFTREWGGVSVGKNLSIAGSGPLGAYLREQALMEVKSRADVGMLIEEPEVIEFEVDVDEQIIDDARAAVTGLAQRILSKAGTQQERFAWEREMDWKMREATGVAKAPQVADLVRMLLESQEKVLLFGWHHAVYNLWTQKLADLRPVRFTGEETPKQKDFNLARFAASNGPRVCMMSLRAGAGIDGLQEHCSTLVFGELDWSPGIHTQCIGRLARDGQPDPVTAYLATTPYGSDPLMTEVLGMKTQQQQHLVGVKLSDQPTLSSGDRLQRLAQAVLDRGTISAGQLAFRFGEPA